MKKVVFSILAVSALVFTSCSSDGDTPINNVTAPTTYKFERNGNSSVSFSGQTTRIKMATELASALKDATKTEAALNGMFAHTAGNTDFSDPDLNASSKSVRSKVAASVDFFAANTTEANAIKAKFDSWIKEQVEVVYPNWAVNAVAGTAGSLEENDGTARYINGKGVELNQIFAKGLIGALMADQILNNYLSPAVLSTPTNITDNDAGTVASGKNYTTMEHKWDEAYGYLYGTEADSSVPVLGADSFLNKYLGKVEADSDFTGIAKNIYDAFKLGRAAIVAKDYALRDKQAEIIREKISEVIAIRTVHYLQAGKTLLATDKAAAFHDLSEGLGFLYSLQFTRKTNSTSSYFTKAEIDGYLSDLLDTGNGLWEASTVATLDAVSNKIAAKFNFTVAETIN